MLRPPWFVVKHPVEEGTPELRSPSMGLEQKFDTHAKTMERRNVYRVQIVDNVQ